MANGTRNVILLVFKSTRLARLCINIGYEYQILAVWGNHFSPVALLAAVVSTSVKFISAVYMVQVAVCRVAQL